MLEKIPAPVLRFAVSLGETWPWLGSKINTIAINSICNASRHRPHPWSTAHDYTSWTSLTDQRWSARHLPAYRRSDRVLPKPEEVIGLFERRNGKQRLCRKSTFLFPSFAQYLTDGFTRTRMPNTSAGEGDEVRRQNTSNHQIDMCPLYGRTQAQTDALRLKSEARGSRGRLKSQLLRNRSGEEEEYAPFLFAEGADRPREEFASLDPVLGLDRVPPPMRARLFAFGGDRANAAPQVAMMNTLFLREHNRLAGEIEKAHPDWDDERVFETARNTIIVLFLKIVVEEYINHISPSVRFRVDPAVAWDAPWNKPNWVTTEFSLLYRWHSLVPDQIRWGTQTWPVHQTLMNNQLLTDSGLMQAFVDASAQPAGRLGAFNTPAALLPVEANAIMQGRLCELAPFGDYCEYAGLRKPRTFEDITRDPEAAGFLKSVYRSPEDVDFYVGLFAEDTVEDSPLPPLILRMVAMDAFSQAFTNPLLSRSVFKPETFSPTGWAAITSTNKLEDIVHRNSTGKAREGEIRMTLPGWIPGRAEGRRQP